MVKKIYRNIFGIAIAIIGIAIAVCLIGKKEGFQGGSVDIVVARYEEDIRWINTLPIHSYSRVYIYNKGSESEFPIPRSIVHSLPNYGREAHTYLHHVIHNYERLADVTLFLPGSAWYKESKQYRVKRVIEALNKTSDSVLIGHRDEQTLRDVHGFTIDSYQVTNEENRKQNPDTFLSPAEDRPPWKMVRNTIPRRNNSLCILYWYFCCFS